MIINIQIAAFNFKNCMPETKTRVCQYHVEVLINARVIGTYINAGSEISSRK